MIKSLTIRNVQSHRDSRLEFSPGINALVGTSNNGKSAVLRALNWAITNRPLGTEILLSNWAYDRKGKQIDEMSVTVEKENSVLTRRKTKTENEYVIDGEKLEAIKTDVPEQVKKFFSLTETNMQKQQDSPFLLSMSSGKIAEYFNRIVRLDMIDRVLSNAESTKRKARNGLEIAEADEKKFESELEKFGWIDLAEKYVTKIKAIDSKCCDIGTEKDALSESVDSYRLIDGKKVFDFADEKGMIEKIESIEKKNLDLAVERQALNELAEEFKEADGKSFDLSREKELAEKIDSLEEKSLELKDELDGLYKRVDYFKETERKCFDLSKEKKVIEKIESMNFDRDEIDSLEESISRFGEADKRIKGCESNLMALKKQLPEVCPLCGARMENGKCTEESA